MVVSDPFGFTVPFSVAELVVMELAEPVVAVGACAAAVTTSVPLAVEVWLLLSVTVSEMVSVDAPKEVA